MNTEHCCICKLTFVPSHSPRMMPNCQHSSCTPCLREAISRHLSYVSCVFCGQVQSLSACDLQHFPLNIKLNKMLKKKKNLNNSQSQPQLGTLVSVQKNNVHQFAILERNKNNKDLLTIPRQFQNNDNQKQQAISTHFKQQLSSQSLRDTLQTNYSFCSEIQKQGVFLAINTKCERHGKQLDILCLKDGVKICSHCALFGQHQEHQIKTVKQVSLQMQTRIQKFKQYCQKKSKISNKLTSLDFVKDIAQKMHLRKDQLLLQTKKIFQSIYQSIKIAQKSVYEDLMKTFKILQQRLVLFTKKQNQAFRRLQLWEKRGQLILQKTNESVTFQKKAEYSLSRQFFGLLEQAPKLLSQAEAKNTTSMKAIQKLIGSISLKQSNGLHGNIMNYLTVVLQGQDDPLSQCQLQTLQLRQNQGLSSEDSSNAKQRKKLRSATATCISPVSKNRPGSNHFGGEISNKYLDITPHQRRVSINCQSQLKGNIWQKSKTCGIIERDSEQILELFIKGGSDALDLNNLYFADQELYQIIKKATQYRQIRTLKIVRNKLTTEGLMKVMQLLPNITNMNLQFNNLDEQSLRVILLNTQKVPHLRIANLTNNKINQCRVKAVVEQLRKQHNMIVQV